MNRIILIEDHERLANLIKQGLASSGIEVDIFGKISHALYAIENFPYGALILDRGLPDGDGLDLLKTLRDANNYLPCIVLTAHSALNDRVNGLDLGADDYLSKPFAMEELSARVKALLRRPAVSKPEVHHYKDLTVDPYTCVISSHMAAESVSKAEMHILLTLMSQPNDVFSHESLEFSAWGLSESVTPNALDVTLHRIRRKLAAINCTLRIINHRGVGYSLRDQ